MSEEKHFFNLKPTLGILLSISLQKNTYWHVHKSLKTYNHVQKTGNMKHLILGNKYWFNLTYKLVLLVSLCHELKKCVHFKECHNELEVDKFNSWIIVSPSIIVSHLHCAGYHKAFKSHSLKQNEIR